MAYRFKRVAAKASGGGRGKTQRPVRTKIDKVALQRAAEQRVAKALGERFAWFLAPVRINAIAEDLRAAQRNRDIDLGVVVIAVILSAFSRSSDAEGRVRDAFALYRQIDSTSEVVDESFRKAMMRAADVLLHLLSQWMIEQPTNHQAPPLRGRLAFFSDLHLTDSTCFKLARALVDVLPGSGSAAALKLHAVYSVRTQALVSVKTTNGREHDSPHFDPAWVPGALYLWDLGYNDYLRVTRAHLAGAYLLQRLKDKANPRMLAWYDAQGRRHAVARGPRGALARLGEVLTSTEALQHGGVLDLDVVIEGEGVECVLRVVCVPTEGQDRYYLTNVSREHFSPCDVAEIYAARWEIELLFKDWQGGCRIDEVSRLSNRNTLRSVIYGGLLAHLLSREVTRAANDSGPPTQSPLVGEIAAAPPELEGAISASSDGPAEDPGEPAAQVSAALEAAMPTVVGVAFSP